MGVACVIMAALVFYAVIARKAGLSSAWASEVAIYLSIYVAFVGAGYAERERSHTHVEILIERLPRRGQCLVYLLWSLISLAAVLALVALGAASTIEAFESARRSVTPLRVPLWILSISLPIGMLLLGTQYALRVLERVNELRG
jgi:C4-dicarboxylate transporter DctQ subunit